MLKGRKELLEVGERRCWGDVNEMMCAYALMVLGLCEGVRC